MTLTEGQRLVVENNMGLVGKVLKDKLHGGNAMAYYSHEDLFQIGCIGLCKAAATDKGIGCFSTYAYRLIWNEICDALILANKRVASETETDDDLMVPAGPCFPSAEHLDLKEALKRALKDAPVGFRKGIIAALLMAEGYSSQEVGVRLNMPANTVRALASRARRYIQNRLELADIPEGGIV